MESHQNFGNSSCPYPFIPELSFPARDGFTSQQVCMDVENVSCCLPCPVSDWRYTTGFNIDLVRWFGLATLILFLFLAITYTVLPVPATRRHYLTIAPLVGLAIMALSFVMQLGPVDQCADPITPNDWTTSHSCAASATCLYYGAWVVILSGFYRSLTLYLHLCWEIDLGDKFMYFSLTTIFGCAGALVPVVFYISGVAYQVGKVCVVSRHRSVESVWGPFLGVSGVALLLQLLVIRYCVCRVLDPFRTMHPIVNLCCTSQTQPHGSSPPPTPASETQARQVSSKIWHVLQPQWRAVSLLLVIIFYTVFLAQTSLRALRPEDYTTEKVMPWASCLVSAGGNPDACMHLADGLGPSEPMIRAAWILLSITGLVGFLCVVRWSMFQGWMNWARQQRTVYSEWWARRGDRDALTDVERVPSKYLSMDSAYFSSSGYSEPLGGGH
ncbi:hypothetical protein BJX64DRAFT_301416 [Aspergillus heterothallicus]